MSETVESRAEIARLARLLRREVDELDYLAEIPSEQLHRLREQVTAVLFDPRSGTLGRLAAASRLLPVGLVATFAQRAFGPVLSARMAGLLEADRAVQMAARLPAPFLADIAGELDPRRAHQLIAAIPPDQISQVARELVRRGDHLTMGSFVGYLEPAAIGAALGELDDEGLIRVAMVLENKASFATVVDAIGADRLAGVIDQVAEHGLWAEALDLLSNLDETARTEVIELAATRDDAVLSALIEAARRQGLWETVLPLTARMSPASRRRFATLPALQQDEVLAQIVEVCNAHRELWVALTPVLAELPERSRARVAALGARGADLHTEP